MVIEPVVDSRRVSLIFSIAYISSVFTVIEVGNQTRSIRSVVDLFGFFTRHLSPILRISGFLSRYQ